MLRSMMNLTMAFAVVASFVLGGPVAQACSCAPPPPPKEAAEKSAAVFAGKVLSVEKAGEFELLITL